MEKKRILIFLGFAIPYILIYKAFFLPGSLAWGDAPFFALENLKELFNLPLLWNTRHDNFGSPQYHILWLYLPTYIYGALNYLLGLGNDILIRIIFYFPATILAIVGSWKLIGHFNQNIWGKFLGSFLYGFNTYFLMLIDGGQVGVALSYGLFPVAAVSILSYLRSLSIRNYIFSLISFFALMSADIRIAFLLVLFVGVIRKVKLKPILFLGLSVLALSAYWIIPSVGGLEGLGGLGGLNNGTNFISLNNSLFLFQPHFPLNQFGKTVVTPFYFALLLPLIFGSLIFVKDRKVLSFSLLFLVLAFLAKGGSEPLGFLYSWFVGLPGGIAFRDSSKFYIPLILTGGILLSFAIRKNWIYLAAVYVFLLILIYPALLGNLSGVLGKVGKNDYQNIYEFIKKDTGFGRSLYFEEKPSQFFGSFEKPAISANNLYKDRPFASMIVGKYDYFNYIHSPQFCKWLDLLGIKYVFLPENERKKLADEKEQEYRGKFLNTLATNNCLIPLGINTSFPAYQNIKTTPLIFAQKKAVLVVGGEGIYDKLVKNPNFSLNKQAIIFTEEGRIDLDNLDNINSGNLVLLFDDKTSKDLQMGYLINQMILPSQSLFNQWKVYRSQDYLVWKYELLKNDLDNKEFDYGKGVAISTISGEKLRFRLPVSSEKNYLAIRALGDVKIKVLEEKYYFSNPGTSFRWEIIGPIKTNNSVEIEMENTGNVSVFNTLALISEEDFKRVGEKTSNLIQKHKTVSIEDNFGEDPILVTYKQINPTEYKITNLPDYPVWLTFTDHYDQGWSLRDNKHLPFYAMVNGFYLDGSSGDLTLTYLPQEKVKLSAAVSVFFAGVIILSLILIRTIKK